MVKLTFAMRYVLSRRFLINNFLNHLPVSLCIDPGHFKPGENPAVQKIVLAAAGVVIAGAAVGDGAAPVGKVAAVLGLGIGIAVGVFVGAGA